MYNEQSGDVEVFDKHAELLHFFESQPSSQVEGIVLQPKSKRTKDVLLVGLGITLVVTCLTFFFFKTCLAIAPTYVKTNQIVNKPFIIYLNETVRSVALDEMKITPRVEGKWTFESGNLLGPDKIIFTPASYFKVNTTYTVGFADAKRVLFGSDTINSVQFKSEPAPGLTTAGLNGMSNNTTIAADYVFSIKLASPNKNLRTLQLRSTPNIPMTLTSVDDTTFTWKPSGLLPQGTNLAVQVYDTKNDVILATKTLQVASAPIVTSPVKKDHFGQNDIATITFNQPIDPASSKYITFSLPGEGTWQSDTIYAFTPQKVVAGQTYSYTLHAGLRTKSGGILATDQTATFATVGSVTVTSSTPHGNGLAQASEQVSFTFDQAVDHTSVSSHFSVSSGTIASTAWQGNTFMATVTNLGYQQTVTAKLTPGIQNSGFGLPSTAVFTDTFTTEIRIIKLNIPYFHQQYAATCAAASLRMILAYHGITTDDMSIVMKMGYNPTVENKSTNPPTWDDPQQMFVGSVNGDIKDGTGAGPDAQPVAAAAEAYGLSASAVTNIGVSWIAQQIYNGDAVISFGAYSNTSFVTWQTPSGRIEKMNLSSHARVVIGVKGDPSNPIGFWVSDPIDGSAYWTAAQLQATIDLDAYNQAVVVY